MTTLLFLLLAIGIAPLAVGMALLRPRAPRPRLQPGSILLCALAFNLTFFWQELWLVIPKALTPGLHPVLFPNNHEWTGYSPVTDLLQGTGAVATLASGMVFAGTLALARRASATTTRLFLFWMAFEGLFQALTQLAIGTQLRGNDVGRALAFLHVGVVGHWALLALAVLGLALAGGLLARLYPSNDEPRAFTEEMRFTAMFAIPLIIPFREPRDVVEVVLIPIFVNLVGAA